MTSLIACVGAGKGTWSYVLKLMAEENWDRIFLITNQFGREKFLPAKEAEFITYDETRTLPDMTEQIRRRLLGKISGFEVAVNLISGTGKEHMAAISAVLKLGLAIRLVGVNEGGVIEV